VFIDPVVFVDSCMEEFTKLLLTDVNPLAASMASSSSDTAWKSGRSSGLADQHRAASAASWSPASTTGVLGGAPLTSFISVPGG
jgi:hypothetical protein